MQGGGSSILVSFVPIVLILVIIGISIWLGVRAGKIHKPSKQHGFPIFLMVLGVIIAIASVVVRSNGAGRLTKASELTALDSGTLAGIIIGSGLIVVGLAVFAIKK